MVASQFVVTELKTAAGQTNAISVDMSRSGIIIRTPPPTPAPATPPPPTPAGNYYEMDMTVFGVRDRSLIPKDGEYTSYKDRASDASSGLKGARNFDPMFATIFLAGTLLLFWGG